MKGIFKILSMVILLAALVGAGVLVKKNQETRRGATAAETSAQVLPDRVTAKAGQTFTVDVWLNTGKNTDKLTGAEFMLAFDPAKVSYVSSAAQNGYTILAEDSEGGADRWFKIVAMGEEKAGAVDVVKLTFKAVSDGASTIIVGKGATVMVSGQSNTWDVARSSGSKIETGVMTVTMVPGGIKCEWCGTGCRVSSPLAGACPEIAPPAGQKCVANETGKGCVIVSTTQKTCISDRECGSNAYCYQPPMPVCKPGMACIEVMPAKYCKACTPRLACMDANPACMPDMAPGAPPFCPKPTTPCGFCGTSCTRLNPTGDCPAIAPANGTKCVDVGGQCVIQKKTAGEGEMCGGIAGIMCSTGLKCEYGLMPEKLPAGDTTAQGMIADRSGICVKEGIYCDNGICPKGYECVGQNTRCPMGPDGIATKCAIRPYCQKIVASPTPSITCNWCGDSCIDSRLKIACKMSAPPAGKSCKNVNGKCTIVPNVTPTPWAACGQRCVQNEQCQGGMTCAPIWWPCGPMPLPAMNKVQADQGLTQEEVADMIRVCPTVKGVMPSGYESMSAVKMPSFYGVCRNPKCLSSTNCSCTLTPTPNGKLKSDLFIWEKLEKDGVFALGENAKVGVQFNVPPQNGYSTAPGRVSVINTRVTFDKNLLEASDVTVDNSAFNNIMKKEIDNEKGLIWLYVGSSKPYTDLSAGISLATITFKTKAEGKAMIGISKSFPIEMSGVDDNGKTVSYEVVVGQDKFVTVGQGGTCQVCKSGATKKSGDANCDGLMNSIDFEIWRSEMFDQGGLSGTVKSTWQSDYNCDQKVSGVDFEIWRKTVFQ